MTDSTVVLSPQVVNSMVRGGHELTAVQVYEGFKRVSISVGRNGLPALHIFPFCLVYEGFKRVSISVGRNGVPALHIFPFCLDRRVSTPLLCYDVNLRHGTGILKYILFSGR